MPVDNAEALLVERMIRLEENRYNVGVEEQESH